MLRSNKKSKYKKLKIYYKRNMGDNYFLTKDQITLLQDYNPKNKNELNFLIYYPFWQKNRLRREFLETLWI